MKRQLLTAVLLLVSVTSAAGQSTSIDESWRDQEKARQFDFWIGKWDVNLRIRQPDNTWKDSIKADAEIYAILDGKAILELWDSGPIKGFSLRYYDERRKEWVLYLNWPGNGGSSIGSLAGKFRHGRGEFLSEHPTGDGGTLISRYTFCDITDTSLRWDDAFSKDGGKTWTNNWIMEFSRTADRPRWPESAKAHTWHSGDRCRGAEFDTVNSLAGRWRGPLTVSNKGKQHQVTANMTAYQILDGCSVIRFLDYEADGTTFREFGLLTYNPSAGVYEELVLDNRAKSTARHLRGKLTDGRLALESGKADKSRLKHEWRLPTQAGQTLALRALVSGDGVEWTRASEGKLVKQPLAGAADN